MFSAHWQAARIAVSEMSEAGLSRDAIGSELFATHDPGCASVFWSKDFGRSEIMKSTLLSRSESLKRMAYSGRVYGIVPIYVSSICAEQCVYCNYRAGNRDIEVERRRLSDEELVAEAEYLVTEKGLYCLELVYPSDPLLRVDAMCRHVEFIKRLLERHGGGCVGINAEPLDERDYRRLVASGASFAVLWQETYDGGRYAELHLGRTKKADFFYRLDAYERMIGAGLRNFGMGVLSGLSDWPADWAMLMQHEAYLVRTYGYPPTILGVPRLKPAAGALLKTTPWIPSTEEYISAVAVHNIFSPSTFAFVNTREDWETCLTLARGGGCLFTFNCSTTPGGYSQGRRGYQFPTASFDAPVFAGKLRHEGLVPILRWTLSDAGRVVELGEGAEC